MIRREHPPPAKNCPQGKAFIVGASAEVAAWQPICDDTALSYEPEIFIVPSPCHWIPGGTADFPGESRTSAGLRPLLQPLSEPGQLGRVGFRHLSRQWS